MKPKDCVSLKKNFFLKLWGTAVLTKNEKKQLIFLSLFHRRLNHSVNLNLFSLTILTLVIPKIFLIHLMEPKNIFSTSRQSVDEPRYLYFTPLSWIHFSFVMILLISSVRCTNVSDVDSFFQLKLKHAHRIATTFSSYQVFWTVDYSFFKKQKDKEISPQLNCQHHGQTIVMRKYLLLWTNKQTHTTKCLVFKSSLLTQHHKTWAHAVNIFNIFHLQIFFNNSSPRFHNKLNPLKLHIFCNAANFDTNINHMFHEYSTGDIKRSHSGTQSKSWLGRRCLANSIPTKHDSPLRIFILSFSTTSTWTLHGWEVSQTNSSLFLLFDTTSTLDLVHYFLTPITFFLFFQHEHDDISSPSLFTCLRRSSWKKNSTYLRLSFGNWQNFRP